MKTTLRMTTFCWVVMGLLVPAFNLLAESGNRSNVQDATPDPMKVVFDYLNKIGGVDRISAIRSATIEGELGIPEAGISGDVTVVQSYGKFLVQVEIAALGKIEIGCNGDKAWELNPQSGDRIMTERERLDAIREYGFLVAELEFIGNYQGRLKYVGSEVVDGKRLVQIEAKPNIGYPSQRFFDEATGLLVKTVTTKMIQGNAIEVTTKISNYLEVGSLLIPHSYSVEAAGQTQTLEYLSIKLGEVDEMQSFKVPEGLSAEQPED